MASPPHIARENGKKGGRPKGSKGKKTLEKQAALAEFQRRVREAIDPLFEAQMTIARGCTYLYYVTKNRRDPQIVTDPKKIALYLKDELKPGKGEYYFISTDRPDNKAIDSLLDRTFGKAHQSIDIQGQMKVAPDDIRALIAALPDAERKQAYAFLARLIEQSKRPGKSGKGAADQR
jgi:hypothetical protein